jgi:hypothetical protein
VFTGGLSPRLPAGICLLTGARLRPVVRAPARLTPRYCGDRYLPPHIHALPRKLLHTGVILGIIILIIGVALTLLGSFGHAIGGRRTYY